MSSKDKDGLKASATDRFERGVDLLRQVGGENYDVPIRALDDIAPALGRFTVDFAYGDVISRPGLDLKTRQLCTVAALAAMGTAAPQLRYHVLGALNVGWSAQEIVEVMLIAAVYAGFPAALNGITGAREVFIQQGMMPAASEVAHDEELSRYEHGMQALDQTSHGSGAAVIESLKDIAPDLGRFVVEFAYGDVIGRPTLDTKLTELTTIAMCTALGTAQPQLGVHINAALNVGVTNEEIVETITQMAVYAGFPAALNGIGVARKVFTDRAK
ncbi:carboxymuconolactone decarboxylase family protein [Ktedonospora formicarum]|uniref:Carboxymuconolactone decarboxylase n=1 Tax=Ktedonospora formicarum TaxID=2778364 RepID=A0A8J3MTZ3_9CHLR|nr:carboxymuconolactone decarboxylase family protein [Ktedonospora formicarum]GHO46421.1 carboxymuconolactone decarboxylase [Ktedonospora formicarum]